MSKDFSDNQLNPRVIIDNKNYLNGIRMQVKIFNSKQDVLVKEQEL